MQKKVYADDIRNEKKAEIQNQENKKKTLENKDESSEVGGASGFSEEEEKKFQQKKKGKMEKLHNVVSKGLIPPTNQNITSEKKGKWSDLKVRVKWSLLMVILFFTILAMGHFYSGILIAIIIVTIFYELIDIPRFKERNSEVKNYYLISWYILCLGIYFSYILMIKDKLVNLNQIPFFNYLLRYHKFICFMLYCFGFLLFLKSLTKGYYRYQFRQLAYIHIIFLIFGFFSSLILANIFNGMVWFIIPVSCVVINDIAAYFWGKSYGKHPLSPLSPKKTWEGFIGALVTTIVWCYFFTDFVCYEQMLCPVEKISPVPFNIFSLSCDISELMKKHELSFSLFGLVVKFTITNIQCHTFFMALFASLIAPLGGLFASGFKRSIKIKDFADTIPGHGGVTDRMDCELLNGAFVYVYLSQFVFYDGAKIVDNLIKKISKLSQEEKIVIFEKLKLMLNLK